MTPANSLASTHRLALTILLLAAPTAVLAQTTGFSIEGQTYRGYGQLSPQAGGGVVARREVQGLALSGPLTWQGGAWRGSLSAGGGVVHTIHATPGAGVLELVLRPTGRDLTGTWRLSLPGAPSTSGDESWRAVGEPSPLMETLTQATAGVAAHGTVPTALLATRGSRVSPRVLVQGREIFAEVSAMIASAEREVVIQQFFWESGGLASDWIVAGLRDLEARRRAQGATQPVRVFVVVNRHRVTTPRAFDALQADVARANLDPRWVAVEVAAFKQHWLGLLHSKTVVIDGDRALITSANVHQPQDEPEPWYELGFTVAGPAARAMRADFAQLWQLTSGASLPPLTTPTPSFSDGLPALVVTRPAQGNVFHKRTDDPAAQALLVGFAQARERIRILTPHLKSDVIQDALLAAVRRGVRVELVVAKGKARGRSRIPGQGGTNQKNVKRLYCALKDEPRAAALLEIRWYSVDGLQAVYGDGANALHAKYATIDGQVAIVGCSNLDPQSIHWSREINLVVDSPELVRAWDSRAFEPVFARSIPAR